MLACQGYHSLTACLPGKPVSNGIDKETDRQTDASISTCDEKTLQKKKEQGMRVFHTMPPKNVSLLYEKYPWNG